MIHLKLIRQHAERAPERTALVDEAGRPVSWRDLERATADKVNLLLNRFANRLPAHACYLSVNSPELIAWLAACATLGIPVTGLDYTLSAMGLRQLLPRIGAELLLVAGATAADATLAAAVDLPGMVRVSMAEHATAAAGDVEDVLERIARGGHAPRPYRAVGLTSGTSGLPKTVIRTKSFDPRRFAYFTQHYGFNAEDRFLVGMPLYHAAGNGWARMFMGLGATLYLASVDQPDLLARTLRVAGITASVTTPALLDRMLDALAAEGSRAVLALRWLLIGGKHFPVPQKQRALRLLGSVVYEYYGTTETGVNTIAEPADLTSHPASVGRAFEGNQVAIVDAAGRPLAPGRYGTVAVSSYMNMDDYGDGEARKFHLDGQSYLATADQGYLDDAGRLYLLNRTARADNLYDLYRLEDAVRCLPGVADVALLQHEGDAVVDCVIALTPAALPLPLLHDQVHALVAQERLQCARLRVVPTIPYSPSGKVRVRDLSSLLTENDAA